MMHTSAVKSCITLLKVKVEKLLISLWIVDKILNITRVVWQYFPLVTINMFILH